MPFVSRNRKTQNRGFVPLDRPLLTIGLPVYNGANYLRAALDSLLAQTFREFVLILSDNCSTDSTPDICCEYAGRDPRVIYHRNTKNIGAAANFNQVVAMANSPYFAWANHDDVYAARYFETCISELESRPQAVLAYTGSLLIDSEGKEIESLLDDLGLDSESPRRRLQRFHRLLGLYWTIKTRINGVWIPVYGVIRTNALRRTGLIGAYISSDTILLEELLMYGEFHEVKEPLFFKRDHSDRSMRASRSYDQRIVWFTGKSTPRFLFPHWRLFWERLRATGRSPLGWRDKLGCYTEMLAFNLGKRIEAKGLIKESWVNARRLFGIGRMSRELPTQW